ncbi:MAG TPA: hypothetical protein VGD67_06850 [Pseudonocardiaceae bacterium]
MSGYEANLPYMASKIGELRGLSDSVGNIATALFGCGAGDLGPGDISGAVRELGEQWEFGLKEMGERIGRMAESVSGAMDNYQAVEDAARDAFTRPYDGYGGRT